MHYIVCLHNLTCANMTLLSLLINVQCFIEIKSITLNCLTCQEPSTDAHGESSHCGEFVVKSQLAGEHSSISCHVLGSQLISQTLQITQKRKERNPS